MTTTNVLLGANDRGPKRTEGHTYTAPVGDVHIREATAS